MKKDPIRFGYDPQENIVSIFPALVAGMINLLLIIAAALLTYPEANLVFKSILFTYGIGGCTYIGFYYWVFNTLPNKPLYAWLNALIGGIGIGALSIFVGHELEYLVFTLVFIATLSSSVISDRGPAYTLIAIVFTTNFVQHIIRGIPPSNWIIHAGFIIGSVITAETIQQLKIISSRQMNRLETVNEISKQIVSTIETNQLISLLDAALQNALTADTYFIGIQEGDEIHTQLFYDDGEYFNDIRFAMKGSLSGWVINNQKPLFLPDLRKAVDPEGVILVTIGKPKDSLSWMGVPMKGSHVDGIIAIASYRPNAFNRSDFELLSNIAQRAALALDNTYHHAWVEEQAQLDSLTRVFNHSHFIQTLQGHAETCLSLHQQLSLIMLDIDHFKQYNDSFGHPVGDEILVNLCAIIQNHIKNTDAVGRWGGEEFAIALPNANGDQALIVAQRVRETLASFKFSKDNHAGIPIPTISMGIAVFPDETDNVTKLIDLADKRLYIAKERGRDQIEHAVTR